MVLSLAMAGVVADFGVERTGPGGAMGIPEATKSSLAIRAMVAGPGEARFAVHSGDQVQSLQFRMALRHFGTLG